MSVGSDRERTAEALGKVFCILLTALLVFSVAGSAVWMYFLEPMFK